MQYSLPLKMLLKLKPYTLKIFVQSNFGIKENKTKTKKLILGPQKSMTINKLTKLLSSTTTEFYCTEYNMAYFNLDLS